MSAPRLTRHQREVLARLRRQSGESRRAVNERNVGSLTTLQTLERKGVLVLDRIEYGPRGGETRYYRPTS